jgi:prepilin-type N-terminal cleavage/methylation domain-containing protein
MRRTSLRSRLIHDERGFTLVEMLVAVVLGVIVMMALFAILDFSINQSGRIAEKVDADQQGRIAMEKLTLELHSSCVAALVTPVQAGSTDTAIQFISVPGSQAYLPTAELHYVRLAENELLDSVFKSNGGEPAAWTFPSVTSTPTSQQTLIDTVSQSQSGEPPTTVPIFQYFRYYRSSDPGAVLGEINPKPMSTPLSSEDAQATAEVTVSFTANPTTGQTSNGRAADLSDSVLLRFNPTSETSNNAACS